MIWLKNSSDQYFPNLWIPQKTSTVMIYSHGNGGTIRDWYSQLKIYSEKFKISILAVEYPGYGAAEGLANEASVNDNVAVALNFLQLSGIYFTLHDSH